MNEMCDKRTSGTLFLLFPLFTEAGEFSLSENVSRDLIRQSDPASSSILATF